MMSLYAGIAVLSSMALLLCGFSLKLTIICFVIIIITGLIDGMPWREMIDKLKRVSPLRVGVSLISVIMVLTSLCVVSNIHVPLIFSGVRVLNQNGTRTVVPFWFDVSSKEGKLLKELSIVVSKNGYGEFLVYGHKVTRKDTEYWVFKTGKEFKLNSFSDEPLMFSSLIVKTHGFWKKTKVAKATGHLIKATWPLGHPEKGKIVNLNIKHAWYKLF